MRRTTTATLALLLLAGCTAAPSSHTEWLAATTGERDTAKVQELLDRVHHGLDMGTGADVDRDSVQIIADLDPTTVVGLLQCMAKITDQEDATGPAAFVDIATRCDADPLAAYE